MSENDVSPPLPETAEVIDGIRAGLTRLLPPEDLDQIDLDTLDAQTPLLSLPVDSAVLMALMTELEDTFTVYIDEEAAFEFGVLGDVADYIRARIAARRLRDG